MIRAKTPAEAARALAIAYVRYLKTDPQAEVSEGQILRVLQRLGEPVPLGKKGGNRASTGRGYDPPIGRADRSPWCWLWLPSCGGRRGCNDRLAGPAANHLS
jgi:hypothetical protein